MEDSGFVEGKERWKRLRGMWKGGEEVIRLEECGKERCGKD